MFPKHFIDLEIKNVPSQMDATDLEKLVIRLREGDDSVKHTIILAHLRLAISSACKFGKQKDFASAAMLGVVVAVEKAREKLTDNNITYFISSHIKQMLHLEVRKLKMKQPKTAKDSGGLPPLGILPIELKEFKSLQLPEIRRVFELRLEGFNNKEIAEKLNISPFKVCQYRSLLKENFTLYFGEFNAPTSRRTAHGISE